MERTIKHYLAGANTSKGFVNYFGFINDKEAENSMTYILKGGPGTGKSTLMKKIGKYYEEKGYSIEYFYCSSDPSSLDGVRIAERNVCVVDGTSPHVSEAVMPAITEIVVNLGECIEDGVKTYRKQIEALLKAKSAHFQNAYGYLRAAGELQKMKETVAVLHAGETFKFDEEKLLRDLDLKNLAKAGKKRNLFLTYIGETGEERLTENDDREIRVGLPFSVFAGTSAAIAETLVQKGYDVTCFYGCIDPEKLYALELPEQNVLLVFEALIDDETKPTAEKLDEAIREFLRLAGGEISCARTCHKSVEQYYTAHLDFEALDSITQNLIDKIDASL